MKTRKRNDYSNILSRLVATGLLLSVAIPASAQNAAWDSRFNVNGFSNIVRAIAIAPNGHVFAGGEFTTTGGGTLVSRVAEWDGGSWSALGTNGVNNVVYSIAVDSQNRVYVGGVFNTAGGSPAGRVAMWNGSTWTDLDGGIGTPTDIVHALAVDDNDDVYAGGTFTVAGGSTALRVARWDGSNWNAVGGGINNNDVLALAIADNGDVYAGGTFTVAEGSSALRVVRWDGGSWNSVGGGVNDNGVTALAVTANGDLYVGGTFTTVGSGSVVAGRVARWNGNAWSDLNGGVTGDVFALAANGNDLYAGGAFTVTGDGDALRIAKWSGGSWSPLGTGTNDNVLAVRSSGNDVWVGGQFTLAGGQSSLRFGRYNPDIVPVLIQAFAARPAEGRVDLAWRTWADEEVSGYRIYRKKLGDASLAAINPGALVPVDAQSYSDTEVRPNETYFYQLAAVTPDGSETRSPLVEARVPGSALVLEQNFPNPFNPITTIRFSAPAGVSARLVVYDARGKLVATLFDGPSSGGAREVQWNGRDDRGAPVSTGVYFYRLEAGKRTLTRKMLLLK